MKKAKPSTAQPKPKPQPMNSMSPSDDIRWMAKDALRTIAEAEQHKKNKPLMREVKKIAKEHMKAVCK